ncbi:MAG: DUF2442 domain-containing protein [Flavobacteriales bacterium]
MNKVTQVVPRAGFQLELTFADGLNAIIEFKPFLDKGIAAELLNQDKFAQVMLEDGGGIAWPNGFDVCPEFLRETAIKRQAAA